ncbi:UDP-2,3-diacylglucosamine diphosphatase [Mangrovimicrobium sediminis]|uniref:UDP-2,3-diacylglucosamine hydrolase n=1 Tax=Mangrovimicrobium sediminis TaxID=2562682 RepID=A0A4Z0M9K0_9GAMM|nr:UDP-2,3-diacylglucosamine diphosphatase [Haliea sp. SAOS-164]TGD76199.1 UDP-2,3-diacylglucosamine diphosphatase [Haliea sp. SAOS-164]
MSRTLFISDLHLDPARPAVTAALAGFLQTHTNCDALYVLGDLFEAWIGDDDDAPLAAEVAELFHTFAAAGPDLYFMRGNRDFLLGDTWCARAGGTLLPDPSLVDLYGTPTLLMHGDSLCTADASYMAFRAQVRDPAWQADVLARPLEERRALAAQLRAQSREASSNKPEDILDVTPAEVERVMREAGVSRLVHGHTHRPGHHEFDLGERWVLGDWEDFLWVLSVDPSSVCLENSPIIQ